RDRTVHVVGRADRGDVDVLAVLGEQLAIVGEFLGAFEALGLALAVERVAVDVANGDDLAELRGVVRVAAPLSADAEAGGAQRFIRRAFLAAKIEGAADEITRPDDGRSGLNKLTTLNGATHLTLLRWDNGGKFWTCDAERSARRNPPCVSSR